MLSITIEQEDFEVNCRYKTRWDSYPGIGKGMYMMLQCVVFEYLIKRKGV
jgi:hypothetical protein